AAVQYLRMTASQVMKIAQQLYEGVEIGEEGPTGLITYMRTDSPSVAKIAQYQAAKFILENYGKEYLPEKPPHYATRTSTAQEAHEAIRPTHIDFAPDRVKKYLKRDEFALYKMIWERFISSQMKPAEIETITVRANSGVYGFEAFRSKIVFDGFTKLWKITIDEGEKDIPEDISTEDRVEIRKIKPEEKTTTPPSRYTEASLIKTLEKFGIGRPSTYAPTISTLLKRKYVKKEGKVFVPEKLGMDVSDALSKYFPDVINIRFTAEMEKELDEIAEGKKEWKELLRDFYTSFKNSLDRASSELIAGFEIETNEKAERIEKNCPECGKPLVIRNSKYGRFIGCSSFPACRYIEKIKKNVDNSSN
ncbi:MAG: DNA topoisomerase, partial [Candidatus Omnitrophica bacterium]|nr:DNA topoisomerase [Candidatus Omnitrophota bacterium]